MKLINMPKPGGPMIECQAVCTDDGHMCGFIISAGRWIMCESTAGTPASIAQDIAWAIRDARNRGIEMGKQEVREALGI